jgi:hypothetical protein
VKWLDRLLIALNLRKPKPERHRGHVPPRAWPEPVIARDDDTLPFVHRSVTIPLSQIPPRPRPAPPHHLRAVASSRFDNPMGDPWVPPGAYGAAASLAEGGEALAPAPVEPSDPDQREAS